MDIFKIKELTERRKAIDQQLQELTTPRVTDIEQVERIYTLFADCCGGGGVEAQSKQGKRLFMAVILSLYSPMALVGGGRMVKGLRNEVQRVLGYQTPEAVSMAIRYAMSEYFVYTKFRDKVNTMRSLIEADLTAEKMI